MSSSYHNSSEGYMCLCSKAWHTPWITYMMPGCWSERKYERKYTDDDFRDHGISMPPALGGTGGTGRLG